MARHRSPGGRPSPVLEVALHGAASRTGFAHRVPVPSPTARGRVVIAAVATGAALAAGQAANLQATNLQTTNLQTPASAADVTPLAAGLDPELATGVGGAPPRPEYLPVVRTADPVAVVSLAKGERMGVQRAAREAEARRPRCSAPAEGTFTSGFGARWGTTHWGIDIANAIGTPILAAADGVVVETGPAAGFGLWVRVQHDDGTVTVYGHVERSLVELGQEVRGGEEIAEMGDRGYSTGPHLHFEVWLPGGEKVDPIAWLADCGVEV